MRYREELVPRCPLEYSNSPWRRMQSCTGRASLQQYTELGWFRSELVAHRTQSGSGDLVRPLVAYLETADRSIDDALTC